MQVAIAATGAAPAPGSVTPATKASFREAGMPLVDAEAAGRDPAWALGRRLFVDPMLSKSGRTSCATCHRPDHAWAGTQPRAIGDGGAKLAFKAPTLFDTGSLKRFGWTGKFADTQAVTRFAITSPNNMGQALPVVAEHLRADADYAAAFRAAFGREADAETILRALAAYTDSLAAEAPFDRWVAGDDEAIPVSARRGFAVFAGKGRCAECHEGPSLTDGAYHDIGSSQNDPGRGALFKTSLKLQHAFKTPSLRGVADRAPYMHDGSKATLAEVVDLYDRGGIDRPSRADAIAPLHLTAGEKADLVAFLSTLSGETRFRLRR